MFRKLTFAAVTACLVAGALSPADAMPRPRLAQAEPATVKVQYGGGLYYGWGNYGGYHRKPYYGYQRSYGEGHYN